MDLVQPVKTTREKYGTMPAGQNPVTFLVCDWMRYTMRKITINALVDIGCLVTFIPSLI
jgi:hypothetical protein